MRWRFFHCVLVGWLVLLVGTPNRLLAQTESGAAAASAPAAEAAVESSGDSVTPTAADPAQAAETPALEKPEIIEELVDQTLRAARVPAAGNTPTHFAIAAGILLLALVLRRLVLVWAFRGLRRLTQRTRWGADDRIAGAVQMPLSAAVFVTGIAAGLSVLKLPAAFEALIGWGYTIAILTILLVLALRVVDAMLDRAQEVARARQLSVAAFMPWIRRTLLAIVLVVGVLLIAQSLGANVRAFLAGLGIGGLAVALAAQDTLANIFGSIVIAVDQPFRLGEFVQIGPNSGLVEDVGLRSTRLRTAQRNLIVIPNKVVAAEPVINLSRFIQRRVEQTIGLTYDTSAEALAALVEEIRCLVLAEEEVDAPTVIVQFTNFGPSSLDLWIAYNTRDPDFIKHLKLKQRINLAIMRAVEQRGLSFAFPTQTVHVASLPPGPAATAAPEPGAPTPEGA